MTTSKIVVRKSGEWMRGSVSEFRKSGRSTRGRYRCYWQVVIYVSHIVAYIDNMCCHLIEKREVRRFILVQNEGGVDSDGEGEDEEDVRNSAQKRLEEHRQRKRVDENININKCK